MPVDEIEELKDSFVKQLSPMRIYLFGSFSEGRQNEDSDFDFYIVVDDSEQNVLQLTTRAYKAIRHKQKRAVDIVINTRSGFERRRAVPSLEREVADKGILLYNSINN